MISLLRDVRYSLRSLIKHPAFTLVAILTLGLGIGVNTAILSTVNGFILRPLPVPNSDELVMPFWGSNKDAEVWGGFSYANYVELRDQNRTLDGLLAWMMTSAGISSTNSRDAGEGVQGEIAWGEIVSGNYFDVLKIKPILGRGFLPEEDRAQKANPVVVLGHNLWQRRFNSDGAIVGKTIFMNGAPFTVIGVAPEKFEGVKYAIRQDFWVPLMMQSHFNGSEPTWETERSWANLNLLGRLKPGVTTKQVEADLSAIAADIGARFPQKAADTKVQVVPELAGRFDSIAGFLKFSAWLAMAVSALVLLVACANVANLMLARATGRMKEIGIRVAIGAGRLHIIRQLLTESILLSLCGGALGWALAYWGTDLVRASFPATPFPLNINVRPDLTVLKWMVLISFLTGLLFGSAPALLASRPNLVGVLKGAISGPQRRGLIQRFNLRGILVVAQVAISVVVLVCAGLFLRSLNRALKIDPGFTTDNLVTMKLDPSALGYSPEEGKRFYSELTKKLEEQPGIQTASLGSFLPLGDSNSTIGPVLKEGEPDPPPNQGIMIDRNTVGPRYFEALDIQLVMGRDFSEQDVADKQQVVIVNQEFARRFYGSEQNALGKRLHFWWSGSPLFEIVGVAKDGLYRSFYEDRRPFIWVPEYQQYDSVMTLLIKSDSPANLKAATETARREIARLDARLPVIGVFVGDQNMSFAYWAPRLAAGMATAFGVLALLLATMGLYSVMTYAVTQQTREIGIRMALGAQISDVLKMVVRHGMVMVIIGLVLGLVGAFLATRVMASLLIGVGATDPISFIGMALLLVLVALVACLIPARRATRVNPLVALRYE